MEILHKRKNIQNRKIQSKGKTELESNAVEMHWFYFGDWKFYSDKRKLTEIKKYDSGELISEEKNEITLTNLNL